MRPYTLFAEPMPLTRVAPWDGNVEPFREALGYTPLGHLVLHDPRSGSFGVLYPLQNGYKNYGPFESLKAFQQAVLDDAGFQEYVLPPEHMAAIVARLGELAPNQVYIPVPYPFAGGSGEPETYSTGKLTVFLAIVGQWQGLESREVD